MSAGLLFLRLVLVFGWTIGSQCDSDVPAAHTIYDKRSIKRNISKRELKCKEGEYAAENICCKMCPPGSFKFGDCTKDKNTTCKPCIEGSTYMNSNNSLDKCRRCKSCDSELDFEVAEHCTVTQNTKCRCKQHYFCNSSGPCHHCDPCSKCENGAIEKECTPTTNTICKRNFWWIFLVVVGIVIAIASLSAIAAYCYKKKRQDFDLNNQMRQCVVHRPPTPEMERLVYPDVDLSTYIPAIVEEMTLTQVKNFVRRHEIPEPAIEQTVHDHLNDSTEQKIKLFHIWYQHHGMKGAYGNLIVSLRKFSMRTVADKIEKKLNVVTSSSQENGRSNINTAEQSSALSDGHNV
ncbi:tumor necrosis factor receptor superfamily member 6 [Emys orbicularis]|uniref:tumor necrosis factor receptor superfamily member 6 n=1 Tax=Emys orbicularis TaxID=82168 RepID=UPI0031FE10B8